MHIQKIKRLSKFKARLSAKKFQQIPGVDYFNIFSPIIRYTTLRLLFAFAAQKNLKIQHLDVKSAFLHRETDKLIYYTRAWRQGIHAKESYVWSETKKQSMEHQAQSNCQSPKKLLDHGFTRSRNDPCVYYVFKHGYIIIIMVFMDDMAFTTIRQL